MQSRSATFYHYRPIELNVGAGTRVRTGDLLITNQLLYLLSYAGILSKY